MIYKYTYGTPIETGAVTEHIAESPRPVQILQAEEFSGKTTISYTMDMRDAVYGLGESVRGINKRGWLYTSFCADDPLHTETKNSLYGAHNFFVVSGAKNFGVFLDSPAKVDFDMGYSDTDVISILPAEPDFVMYVITGDSLKDIVKSFRKIIGKSYKAPAWAFGFQQSRWGYKSADDIRNVCRGYRHCGIPLDAIYMDIDYMTAFKDFTVDPVKYPDFKDFVLEMKEQNIHLVPIIDAGVKIEKGYDVYEEGVKNNYFCKDENGNDFVSAVWPGVTHFPDFFQSSTAKWFGAKYKTLTDMGIEGFWNDMNEPAIFYSQSKLDKAWEQVESYKGKNLDIDSYFKLRDVFSGLEDYTGFYHNINGTMVRHDKVHNLYGTNMTKSAAEAFDTIAPNKRMLMFSRSSYIGAHRFGGIWTGDNQSWWQHILLCLSQLPGLNMCGFMYIGSDIGGFGAHSTEDLVLRWLALGVFTPLMRNHSALGTRSQECYNFKHSAWFKEVISVRYALLPYIYSEYMKSINNDEMMFRPLAFDYPNDIMAKEVNDQLMLGDSIMIAPVYVQNAGGRYVYLPEEMLCVKMRGDNYTYQVLAKGSHYINVAINEVPFFVRTNGIVPMVKSAASTNSLDLNHMKILAFVKDNASYKLYTDDGISKNTKGDVTTFNVTKQDSSFSLNTTGGKEQLTLILDAVGGNENG